MPYMLQGNPPHSADELQHWFAFGPPSQTPNLLRGQQEIVLHLSPAQQSESKTQGSLIGPQATELVLDELVDVVVLVLDVDVDVVVLVLDEVELLLLVVEVVEGPGVEVDVDDVVVVVELVVEAVEVVEAVIELVVLEELDVVVEVVTFKKNTLGKEHPDKAASKLPESSTQFELSC